MRDILEDADAHRDDGYGRAQHHTQNVLPKRFYKQTGFAAIEGGYSITLDGKATKTPGLTAVIVPNEALATEMASEWSLQEELINPETMPIVRLVNSALEAGADKAPALRDEIIKYAANDMLLYRADSPQELVAAQEAEWDNALTVLARHFDIKFQSTVGIIHQEQPTETLERLASTITSIDLIPLTAMLSITGLTGSGLLTIALHHGLLDGDKVWTAAHVDEDHNIRLWGEDSDAVKRRAKRRTEFDAAIKIMSLLS